MAIPTDRGYLIVDHTPDGKLTISISTTAPIRGKSTDVFAQHVGESAVHIDPSVSLVKDGRLSWTTRPVRVFVGQGGLVNVAPPRASSLGG